MVKHYVCFVLSEDEFPKTEVHQVDSRSIDISKIPENDCLYYYYFFDIEDTVVGNVHYRKSCNFSERIYR